jgi:hypothetical protein
MALVRRFMHDVGGVRSQLVQFLVTPEAFKGGLDYRIQYIKSILGLLKELSFNR